jgi:hypothetical protein
MFLYYRLGARSAARKWSRFRFSVLNFWANSWCLPFILPIPFTPLPGFLPTLLRGQWCPPIFPSHVPNFRCTWRCHFSLHFHLSPETRTKRIRGSWEIMPLPLKYTFAEIYSGLIHFQRNRRLLKLGLFLFLFRFGLLPIDFLALVMITSGLPKETISTA